MDISNQKLEELIEAINHISLNQEDLLSACTEFSKAYFKKDKKAELEFDKFWNNYFFIEQSCISSREAIVLGLHALTLAIDINFELVMDRCVNLETQRYNFTQISTDVKEVQILEDYFTNLRKELFSRVYSQNKGLQKVTEIPHKLLKIRYDNFMQYKFK